MTRRTATRDQSAAAAITEREWVDAVAYTYITFDQYRWDWSLKHNGRYLDTGWALTETRAERAAERARARHLRRLRGEPAQWRARLRAILHPRRTRSERTIAAALSDL